MELLADDRPKRRRAGDEAKSQKATRSCGIEELRINGRAEILPANRAGCARPSSIKLAGLEPATSCVR
jgi:hypothetical protein